MKNGLSVHVRGSWKYVFLLAACVVLSGTYLAAQTIPSDYQSVLTYLNRTGDFSANVLKVNIPRNDVQIA
jgi:hypothetical protein